ncbi:MAG: RNA helicase [Proteobacteria bacterium]|nr:MAG: RNA helicase [Pseudomonadota bacterium]
MENLYLSNTRFDSFPLHEHVLTSLQKAGFEYCSRIQAETLPLALSGHDVTGQAQTGTGKTGAFLVAAFQRLLNASNTDLQAGSVRCLILAPTRELAIQIARDADVLGKYTGLRSVLVYGGANYDKQRRQFERPVDLLIGTPGRVIDYWKQGVYDFKQTEVLVLDEADRMFDMGFIQDVRFLLRRLPPPAKRLNMLFSATLSQKVLELAYEHMNNPAQVKIETASVSADNIAEHVYYPGNQEKIPLLVGLIRKLQPSRAIVFVNTKHNAEKIKAYLRVNAVSAAMISGDVRQKKRERLLQDFGAGKYQVLIATDVAARGLHIADVTHVFNFDLPQVAEDYVHRIGRTARAGASGEAHSFACEDTAFYLPDIEEYTGKSLPVISITPDLVPELQKPSRAALQGRHSVRHEARERKERSRSSNDRQGKSKRKPVNQPPPRKRSHSIQPELEVPAIMCGNRSKRKALSEDQTKSDSGASESEPTAAKKPRRRRRTQSSKSGANTNTASAEQIAQPDSHLSSEGDAH